MAKVFSFILLALVIPVVLAFTVVVIIAEGAHKKR